MSAIGFLKRARSAIQSVEKKSNLKMSEVFYTDVLKGNLPLAKTYRHPSPGSEKLFEPLASEFPLKNEFLSKGYQFQRPAVFDKDAFLDRPVSEEDQFYEDMQTPISDFNINNYDLIAPFILIRPPHFRTRGSWAKRNDQE
eukprot:TRINITY_DN4481_c0_g1_i1.p1 TRINITY_DN4481_c0_g1~~TRINITY_DN4481_c0_g1_i1.p1  ORF type:complete len:141 (+),score=47.88 TRINITY_DN4481_c0_g1_i1:66-488(+)